MDSRNKKTFIALILAAVLIAAVPVIALNGRQVGGSDDAGSGVVEEIHDDYQPGLPRYWKPFSRERSRESWRASSSASRPASVPA